MKRKPEIIVLDDDDRSDRNGSCHVASTTGRDISRSPPRRLASLALSDSSRTISPEPRTSPNFDASCLASHFADRAPHHIMPRIPNDNRRKRELDAARPISSEKRLKSSSCTPKNTTRSAQEKTYMDHQVIDLDDEVIEICPINLDEGEVIDVEALESELAEDIFQVELEDDYEADAVRLESSKRNQPIKDPLKKIDVVHCRTGPPLHSGDTVQLKNGRFLEIKIMMRDVLTREVRLRGWGLKRTRDLEGQLKFRLNELCYIFDIDLDDPRPMREQSMIEVSLDDVRRSRALTRTNYPFPAYRFDLENLPPGDDHMKRRHVEAKEGLVVRWQYITIFNTARDRERQSLYSANYQSRKFVRIDEKECDVDRSLPPYAMRYQWRDDTMLRRQNGGKESDEARSRLSDKDKNLVCIDISDDEVSPGAKGNSLNAVVDTRASIHISSSDFAGVDPQRFMENIRRRFEAKANTQRGNANTLGTTEKSKISTGDISNGVQTRKRRSDGLAGHGSVNTGHQYSYADAFCGAGGATRGAVMAGLRVIWGLDFNPNAAETWRYNFPQARIYEMWADEVCSLPDPDGKLIVDILHLSPPCQVWSPAHTVPGKDDDMNFASLFAVQELIAKAKPRIITLEQTFGIIHRRFSRPFNSLIRMFTDHNFSVSWQILELERLGLPQRRKRLIIVAAAPGETVPPIPKYTHSRYGGNGLMPFRSAQSALSSIPRNAANHEIPSRIHGSYLPWDASTILPCCITTAGPNGRGHPSGQRGLTCREVASLQTFPHEHVFLGQGIRKQIGNAVPPQIAKLVFSCARKHLEKVDADERG